MASDANTGPSREFLSLKFDCLKRRTLYEDPDFPPTDRSLYADEPRTGQFGRVIWKRPRSISRNPQYIIGDVGRHDLNQGFIGNCWFVAAAAVLCTSNRAMFHRVVPQDQQFDREYAGIFRFYFWWYGEWKEIIIDDFLPTNGQRLIFCSNRQNQDEFWCALFEKAYAKLRGGYIYLDGGKVQDALVDFTGGIGEVIDLEDKNKIPRNLFSLLHKCIAMNSLVGCSIHRPPNATSPEVKLRNGLYMGHAYSITGIREVPFARRSAHLLRIRNPWGRGEWNGPFSDRSPEMASLRPEVRNDLRMNIAEDGEFWISYGDLIDNFDEIELCHLQPDAFTEELASDENTTPWNVVAYHDSWKRGLTAGGCGNRPHERLYWINPQFFVTLQNTDEDNSNGECTMIVSLTEKEQNNKVKIAIGFDVYRLRHPELKPLNGERAHRNSMLLAQRSGKYQYYREVTKHFEFSPGVYVIVPSTFHPFEEAKFLLRIFTEKIAESGVLDVDDPQPVAPISPVSPVTPVTPKLDGLDELILQYAGGDTKLDYKELKSFIATASYREFGEQLDFSEEACRSLVTCMDRNRSGFLGRDEARKMWKEINAYRRVFRQFDQNRSGHVEGYELETMFSKLGFPINRQLLQCILRRYGGRKGSLTLDAFVIVICKLVLMFDIFKEHETKARTSDGEIGIAQFTMNEFLQYTMFC